VEDAANTVSDKASELASSVGDKASELADRVQGKSNADKAEDKAEEAKDKTKDAASDAKGCVSRLQVFQSAVKNLHNQKAGGGGDGRSLHRELKRVLPYAIKCTSRGRLEGNLVCRCTEFISLSLYREPKT